MVTVRVKEQRAEARLYKDKRRRSAGAHLSSRTWKPNTLSRPTRSRSERYALERAMRRAETAAVGHLRHDRRRARSRRRRRTGVRRHRQRRGQQTRSASVKQCTMHEAFGPQVQSCAAGRTVQDGRSRVRERRQTAVGVTAAVGREVDGGGAPGCAANYKKGRRTRSASVKQCTMHGTIGLRAQSCAAGGTVRDGQRGTWERRWPATGGTAVELTVA